MSYGSPPVHSRFKPGQSGNLKGRPKKDLSKFAQLIDGVFESDVEYIDDKLGRIFNAIDPDLRPFRAHGGKLIVYHGWNDQLITPLNSIDYYNSVSEKLGGAVKIDGSFRLFMAPGMNHCSGGDGPSRFDAVSALEQWVEQGKAPERIVATEMKRGVSPGEILRTRPLCAYPLTSHWTGSGSTDSEDNFVCR